MLCKVRHPLHKTHLGIQKILQYYVARPDTQYIQGGLSSIANGRPLGLHTGTSVF